MEIKLRLRHTIAVVLALMAVVALSSPHKAMALTFDILKEDHSVEYNIDQPGVPGVTSGASQSGSQTQNIAGAQYNLSAQSSVDAWISSGFGTSGRGAGGYRMEIWEVTLILAGEDGDQADLYIEGSIWGDGTYFISHLYEASSSGTVEAYLGITNDMGDELFSYSFFSSYTQKIAGQGDYNFNEFQENINSFLFGTASVGDEITIYGYLYQGATAGDLGGLASIYASADTNSVFSFQIDAFESSQPVPEPATVILLGSGLIGFAGLRRRFKK